MTNMIHSESNVLKYANKTNRQIARTGKANKSLFESVREGYLALSDCKESLSLFKFKIKADRSTINKIIKIASNDFVMRNLERLPVSWSTLYTIAVAVPQRIDEETAESILEDDLINKNSSQKEVVDVFASYLIPAAKTSQTEVVEQTNPLVIYYHPSLIDEDDRERVDQAISVLTDCNFEVQSIEIQETNEEREAA